MKIICALIGHKFGTPAGRRSWYDRCPRCRQCILRPMDIAFRDRAKEEPPPTSTAERAAAILNVTADTLRDRDAEYRGADALYAATMAALFPNGVRATTPEEHHRLHLFMLMIVKVTRYARNWEEGHPDSLTDLAAYAGMLAAIDAQRQDRQRIIPPG